MIKSWLYLVIFGTYSSLRLFLPIPVFPLVMFHSVLVHVYVKSIFILLVWNVIVRGYLVYVHAYFHARVSRRRELQLLSICRIIMGRNVAVGSSCWMGNTWTCWNVITESASLSHYKVVRDGILFSQIPSYLLTSLQLNNMQFIFLRYIIFSTVWSLVPCDNFRL